MVAFGRALADAGLSHVEGFSDPTAYPLLGDRWRRRVDDATRGMRAGKANAGVEMARVQADAIALRTVAIDTAVRDALAGGATQLVILGAGYDGRAWRLGELAGVNVYEVDRPATQEDKRARAAALPPAIGRVTYVPTDFTHESLDAVLERAGHDAASPTCWIWEGVVMYLTHEAERATLADIARRSARGSTLIVNYHSALRRFLVGLVLRLIGEPQISAWTPEEMAADLRAAGFTVQEDSGMPEWNQRFARGQAKVERFGLMRVVVARR